MSKQKNKKKVWIWVCVLLAACLLLMFFNRPRIPSEGIKSVILYPVPSGQLVLTDEEEIRELTGIINRSFFLPIPLGQLFTQAPGSVNFWIKYIMEGAEDTLNLPYHDKGIITYKMVDDSALNEFLERYNTP